MGRWLTEMGPIFVSLLALIVLGFLSDFVIRKILEHNRNKVIEQYKKFWDEVGFEFGCKFENGDMAIVNRGPLDASLANYMRLTPEERVEENCTFQADPTFVFSSKETYTHIYTGTNEDFRLSMVEIVKYVSGVDLSDLTFEELLRVMNGTMRQHLNIRMKASIYVELHDMCRVPTLNEFTVFMHTAFCRAYVNSSFNKVKMGAGYPVLVKIANKS